MEGQRVKNHKDNFEGECGKGLFLSDIKIY